MLRILTGPSYPVLETALIEEVRRIKSDAPLKPVALIFPSAHLVTGIRRRLAADGGLTLLNVHFLTFYQLALRLAEERRAAGDDASESSRPPDVVSDFFFEKLLAQVLSRGLPSLRRLARPDPAPGAAAALWATIRDLKDAAVEPAAALRALAEGHFPADEQGSLEALFTLQAAMLEGGRALGVGTADDLTAQLIGWTGRSSWLGRLEQAIYYGFYDLTQIQLSFFEAVTARVPATVYFPESPEPAFAFSRRFLERYLSKASVAIEAAPPAAGPPARPRAVSLMNAVGPEDELTAVCKEILDLVETRGYDFGEIGVVARSLTPYQALLRRLFDQHRIPLTTTAGRPVLQSPLTKTLLQLARLPSRNLDHRLVLDVVCSPFHRGAAPGGRPAARPEQWRWLVGELGIRQGEADWARLAQVQDAGTAGEGLAEQAALLHALVSRLIEDCRALPQRGGPAALTEAFLALAAEHLLLPDEAEVPADRPPGSAQEAMAAVREACELLRQLDRLGLGMSWEEWTAAFAEALERTASPVEAGPQGGVQVMEAMAARGLTFRALFLIGMNEKVFPRVVREDAFLRDRHRRVLAETLGYKIDDKLGGYDEEQLLFTLLCRSATERLCLSYQRADDSGRLLAPSPYLEQAGAGAAQALSRLAADRVGRAPFLPALLTPQEWALHQIGLGRDVSELLAATGREATLFCNAITALQAIEGEEAGTHDGLTGPLDQYWSHLTTRGIAPTPLEQYARCPFQYFAAQVLRLAPSRGETAVGPTPLILGDLCHASLRLAYGRLLAAGWPEQEGASREVARSAAEEVFAAYAEQCGAGYPLLWTMARDTIAALVAAVVEEDRRDCLDSGFRPAAFEVEAEGDLDQLGVADLKGIKVSGRLDRIDRRMDAPGWRIVDYKFKQGREMLPDDRNLVTAAVRGARLQPPLYALMRPRPGAWPGEGDPAEMAERPEQVELLFLAPAWEQTIVKSVFHLSEWQGAAAPQLTQTLARILGGIRAGHFVILPADLYCDSCDFSPACRRYHGPTERRSGRAVPARELRLLRKQKVDRA